MHNMRRQFYTSVCAWRSLALSAVGHMAILITIVRAPLDVSRTEKDLAFSFLN